MLYNYQDKEYTVEFKVSGPLNCYEIVDFWLQNNTDLTDTVDGEDLPFDHREKVLFLIQKEVDNKRRMG